MVALYMVATLYMMALSINARRSVGGEEEGWRAGWGAVGCR